MSKTSSANAPVGYLGAKAIVYFAEGVRCQASTWGYNTSVGGYYQRTFNDNCGGFVYSRGASHVFNSSTSAYVTTYTNRTANYLGD